MDAAVPTSMLHAAARPGLELGVRVRGWVRVRVRIRYDSMVRSQVWHGRPDRQFQSHDKEATLKIGLD